MTKENAEAEPLFKIPQNCDFRKVFNASNHSNECSPKLDDKFFSSFSGMLINGPKQVTWSRDLDPNDFPTGPWGTTDGPLRLMVAGLVRTEYKTLGLNGETSDHVLLVAVDRKTAVAYYGKMPRPQSLPPLDIDTPDYSRSEEELNALLTNHFNFDLIHDLGVPLATASYSVYATLGTLKSNTIIIKTTLE